MWRCYHNKIRSTFKIFVGPSSVIYAILSCKVFFFSQTSSDNLAESLTLKCSCTNLIWLSAMSVSLFVGIANQHWFHLVSWNLIDLALFEYKQNPMFEWAVLYICLLLKYHLNKNNWEQNDKNKLNMAHKEARNIVERTIGVLKSRFGCLLSTFHYPTI